jgi:hypothetical protein
MLVKLLLTLLVIQATVIAILLRPRPVAIAAGDPGMAEAALSQELGPLQAATPQQAVDLLAARCAIRIVVDWDAIKAAGLQIEPDQPIAYRRQKGRLREALNQIFRPVPGDRRVTYNVVRETLTVTTASSVPAGQLTTRIYDVHDLIDDAYFHGNYKSDNAGRGVREERLELLAWLICEYFTSDVGDQLFMEPPDSATGAQVHHFGGKLVVLQSTENHREIERLLALLRAAK